MNQQTNATKIIDARGLEPPEPFVQAMDALDTCASGEKVLLLLSREPYPLYQALELNGFSYQTRHAADGTVEVLSWRKAK